MKTIETVNSPMMKKSASKCKKGSRFFEATVLIIDYGTHFGVSFEENILFFNGKYFVPTRKKMRLLYTMWIPYKRNRRLY